MAKAVALKEGGRGVGLGVGGGGRGGGGGGWIEGGTRRRAGMKKWKNGSEKDV